MTLTNLEVVRVMGWSDLNDTSTSFHICMLISNNRDWTINNWKHYFLTNQVLIAWILWINCTGSITQHGLRTSGSEFQESSRGYRSIILDDWVLNMPEVAGLLLILNLSI